MTTTTMRAVFGGSGQGWTLRDAPVPTIGPNEVLVRTRAVSLNNADVGMADQPQGDGGFIAGYELAGELTAVGAAVDGLAVGDRVMGTTPASFAQYVAAHHRHVIPVPDGITDEQACALPTALLTEHGALELAGFRAGQAVLITGATSAIGLVGVQIARVLGAAKVIATTRSASKEGLLRDVGATDVVVVGADDRFTTKVIEASGGDGVEVVLDHVGGELLASCLDATRVGARLISIGRLDRSEVILDLATLATRGLTLQGVSFGFTPPERIGRVLDGLRPVVLPAVEGGRIHAVIDSVRPFAEAPAALERVRSGHAEGKLVLTVP